MEIMKLFFTRDEDLYDKKINEVFDEEFFPVSYTHLSGWRSACLPSLEPPSPKRPPLSPGGGFPLPPGLRRQFLQFFRRFP